MEKLAKRFHMKRILNVTRTARHRGAEGKMQPEKNAPRNGECQPLNAAANENARQLISDIKIYASGILNMLL